MRRNRQKEKTPDASGHMAAAPGVCCYLFVLVCEIEFLAVIVRIRHTFQLGKGLLGQRPHIPVHTRHGCGDLAYRPASVCVVVHTGIERSGVKRIRLHDLRHSHARNRRVFLPTGIKRWTESEKYGKISIRNDIVKSEFIKEDMDETVFMFALFKCRKFDKRRN